MNKFQIVATHIAFGTVVFIIEAEADKLAFTKWKQVVFSGRQWTVKSNTQVVGEKRAPAVASKLSDLVDDLD